MVDFIFHIPVQCAMNSKHLVLAVYIDSLFIGFWIWLSLFAFHFHNKMIWGRGAEGHTHTHRGFDLLCCFEAAIKIYNISHFMVKAMKRSNAFCFQCFIIKWIEIDFILVKLEFLKWIFFPAFFCCWCCCCSFSNVW